VGVEDWIHDNVNVCIRTDIFDSTGVVERQVIIRFSLLYRIGEDPFSGKSDEKVRYEAAIHAWLKENCPTVPISRLYGFGLSSGKTVSHLFIIIYD